MRAMMAYGAASLGITKGLLCAAVAIRDPSAGSHSLAVFARPVRLKLARLMMPDLLASVQPGGASSTNTSMPPDQNGCNFGWHDGSDLGV